MRSTSHQIQRYIAFFSGKILELFETPWNFRSFFGVFRNFSEFFHTFRENCLLWIDHIALNNFILIILYYFLINLQQYQQLVSEVREFYFGNAEIDEKLIEPYVTLFSDLNFAYHAYKAAKLHAQKTNSKTFLYQ